MTLAPTSRLGPYEIVAPLGAGGMGEVYRARDTRLERSVAIKVLPREFASNTQLKLRFEREAKTISQLEHPHICRLYDIGEEHAGEAGGAPLNYLVMELLEGESLADRLTRGPLPMSEVLRSGVQIAEALATAHRAGVVHRDLKPGNIMLTKSGAKLLDFGLAKSASVSRAPASSSAYEAATQQKPLTEQGTILGTYQYMAPEQLAGEEADARTDIFALGAVLYEMATGKRAFEGSTKTSLIAAIVSADPKPVSELQPLTPPALEHVIRKCLEKDPDRRWQSAHDIAEELRWISEAGSRAGVAAVAGSRIARRAAWPLLGLATLLLVVATAIAVRQYRRAEEATKPARLSLLLPEKSSLRGLSIDPSGRNVCLVVRNAEGRTQLWLRSLDSLSARPLGGTENASYPFWSPDGKFIGFFADGQLKKVALTGGPPQSLAPVRVGRGGAWNRDGVIVYTPDAVGPLRRVSAGGGTSEEATKIDPKRGESTHRWPLFLPDGEHFLCLISSFASGGQQERLGIYAVSLKSGEQKFLLNVNSNVAYVEPGYLLYARGRMLVAQKFDASRLTLAGDPFPVEDDVHYFPQVHSAQFTASPRGVVMFAPASAAARAQFVWVDRTGKELGRVGQPGYVENGRISPDGQKVAFDATDPQSGNTDLFIADAAAPTIKRITFDASEDFQPVWTPDGKDLLYTSVRKAGSRIFRRRAAGGATDVAIHPSLTRAGVIDVALDGTALFWERDRLLLGAADGSGKLAEFMAFSIIDARLSPDGKWVAYSSAEAGPPQVYVVSSAGASAGRWQVSTSGGTEPRWRGDGGELFYLTPDQTVMSVVLATGDGVEPSLPKPLFRFRVREPVSGSDASSYDVTRDGQRFLVNTDVEVATAPPVHVLLNWPGEVER